MANLLSKTRQQVNRFISKAGMDGNGRFEKVSHALSAALDCMRRVGLELGEVPSLPETDRGTCALRLALSNAADSFSPEEVRNSRLAMSWTKLGENRFEVIAYLS